MALNLSDIGQTVGRALSFGGMKEQQSKAPIHGSHRAASNPSRDNARTPVRNESRIHRAQEMPPTMSQCPENFPGYRLCSQVVASGSVNVNGQKVVSRYLAPYLECEAQGPDGAGSKVSMVCALADMKRFGHPQAALAEAKLDACYENNYAHGAGTEYASAMPDHLKAKQLADRRVAGRSPSGGAAREGNVQVASAKQDSTNAFFRRMNNINPRV